MKKFLITLIITINLLNASTIFKDIKNGNKLALKQYIANNENINAKNKFGDTLLHIAVSSNKYEITKLLIKSGAKLDSQNTHGETPLILALRNKNDELAQLLICNNADISLKDQFNLTPINYATLNNDFKTLSILKSTNLKKSCTKPQLIPQEKKQIIKSASSLGLNNSDDLQKYISKEFSSYMNLYDYKNKTFVFNEERYVFDNGSTRLNDTQKIIFVDFFERLANMVNNYDEIKAIKIIGNSSSDFRSANTDKSKDIKNLNIAEKRANNTLQYLKSIYNLNNKKYKKLISITDIDKNIDTTNSNILARRVDFEIILK